MLSYIKKLLSELICSMKARGIWSVITDLFGLSIKRYFYLIRIEGQTEGEDVLYRNIV